jgi:glycosyltransferase involved in cell wall biosynthesis
MMISGSYPKMKCGVGDYTYLLIRYLCNHGMKVKVITSKNKNVKNSESCLPIIDSWGLKCIKKIINRLVEDNGNIIHIQYPTKGYGYNIGINLLPLYIKLFNHNNYKIILTLHEFSQTNFLRKLAIIPLILFSDKIIFTNYEEKDIVSKVFFFLNKRKFTVINIGPNIIPKLPNQKTAKKTHTITYFGFIRPDKGIDVLLKAIKLTKIYKEKDFILNIIAELENKDKYHKRIIDLIDRLDNTKINVTGFLSEEKVSEKLYETDLSVLPFTDGLTYRRGSFIASVAHDVPVISTYSNLTSLDLYDSLKNYLVKPYDINALAEKIDKFFYDEDYRAQLYLITSKIKGLFDWNIIAETHIELYKCIGGLDK